MNILIADDDVFFRKFYGQKLSEQGFTVQLAATGHDVLGAVAKARPDVVLLDLIMPGMDGFEVLTKLSQNPALKGLPVIVFSTLNQAQDIERAKALGAVDFVNKSSLNFAALVAKIRAFESKKA